jgi:two-component system, chemotaxis family, sensor kinase CheA
MGPKDKELLKRLLATFKVEAEEHVTAISSGLVKLERESSSERQMEIVESVFREAHSLKGAARAVNLVKIEGACQSLEGLFARLKVQEIALSPELFDQLHQVVDTLGVLLSAESSGTARVDESGPLRRAGTRPPVLQSAETASYRPSTIRQPENPPEPGHFADQKRGLSETLRVPAAKLDALLRQAEELIPAKATAAQRVMELYEIGQTLVSWETEWRKTRPQANALPLSVGGEHRSNGRSHSSNGHAAAESRIMQVSVFLNWNERALNSVKQKVSALTKHLEYDRRALDRRVDDLVEDMKRSNPFQRSCVISAGTAGRTRN